MTASRKYLRPEVIQRIATLELRVRAVVEGFISGQHRSPYHGFSVEFAEHREYVPGDDIRHVDWRVYAKADRYYVKQYEEETNLATMFALDASRSMAYPAGVADDRLTKFEYGACIAASLAYLLMRQQDAAGMLVFDEQVREEMAPTSHLPRLHEMIERVDRIEPQSGTDAKTALMRLASRMPRRGLVVLISDLLCDVDTLTSALQHLRIAGHDVLVLQVLDHDEVTFPFRDNTLFEGLEAPHPNVLTDPQSLRAGYLAVLDAFLRQIRSACLNQGIDYAMLSTADPLDVALTRFLAGRMHRLRR
jgi:uncharacterized protein (DUF58 family)